MTGGGPLWDEFDTPPLDAPGDLWQTDPISSHLEDPRTPDSSPDDFPDEAPDDGGADAGDDVDQPRPR